MRRLGKAKVETLVAEMQQAANPENWENWHKQHCMDVTLELPLGEVMNPRISGFVWAWKKQGKIKMGRIQKRDRFNAQGLEGKAIVRTTLVTALLVCRELPPYRCRIFLL